MIDPYAGETIDGQETYTLKAKGRAGVVCDGTRCYTTVPAVPDTVANAGYATSAGYADSAGSVAGISNPMSRDAGAGGIGSIVLGSGGGEVAVNGLTGQVQVYGGYLLDKGLTVNQYQTYGGTWRCIGTRTLSSGYWSMWQRIA